MARIYSNKLSLSFFLTSLSLMLIACGGGGSSTDSPSAATSQNPVNQESNKKVQLATLPQIDTSKEVIEGQSVTFQLLQGGIGEGVTYQWKRNNQDIVGETKSTLTIPTVTLADNQSVYTLQAYNLAGKILSNNAILTVKPRIKEWHIATKADNQEYQYLDGQGWIAKPKTNVSIADVPRHPNLPEGTVAGASTFSKGNWTANIWKIDSDIKDITTIWAQVKSPSTDTGVVKLYEGRRDWLANWVQAALNKDGNVTFLWVTPNNTAGSEIQYKQFKAGKWLSTQTLPSTRSANIRYTFDEGEDNKRIFYEIRDNTTRSSTHYTYHTLVIDANNGVTQHIRLDAPTAQDIADWSLVVLNEGQKNYSAFWTQTNQQTRKKCLVTSRLYLGTWTPVSCINHGSNSDLSNINVGWYFLTKVDNNNMMASWYSYAQGNNYLVAARRIGQTWTEPTAVETKKTSYDAVRSIKSGISSQGEGIIAIENQGKLDVFTTSKGIWQQLPSIVPINLTKDTYINNAVALFDDKQSPILLWEIVDDSLKTLPNNESISFSSLDDKLNWKTTILQKDISFDSYQYTTDRIKIGGEWWGGETHKVTTSNLMLEKGTQGTLNASWLISDQKGAKRVVARFE